MNTLAPVSSIATQLHPRPRRKPRNNPSQPPAPMLESLEDRALCSATPLVAFTPSIPIPPPVHHGIIAILIGL